MKLIFYLSGEHPTLPKSEALWFLRHRGLSPEVKFSLDQILICKVKGMDNINFKGLSMTHEVLEFIGLCPPVEAEIKSLASQVGVVKTPFSVRIKRIKHHSKDLKTSDVEKLIGDRVSGRVNLERPNTILKGFLSSDWFMLGRSVVEMKRAVYNHRGPKYRPFFHPSSLSPVLSRAICNIAGVSKGKRVLDPFCGTGGILIEAGLLGGKIQGIDLDINMVDGCRRNLSFFGVKGRVDKGDATRLGVKEMYDIVVTDPPYGRASTTMGWDSESLFKKSMESIYIALKKSGTACIISPGYIDLEQISRRIGFTVLETHLIRVHKSLNRKIIILRK